MKWLTVMFLLLLMVAAPSSVLAGEGSKCMDGMDPGFGQVEGQRPGEWAREKQEQASIVENVAACAAQVISTPLKAIWDNCGCRQAIEQHCDWGWKKGKFKISGVPGCAAFKPLLMGF